MCPPLPRRNGFTPVTIRVSVQLNARQGREASQKKYQNEEFYRMYLDWSLLSKNVIR